MKHSPDLPTACYISRMEYYHIHDTATLRRLSTHATAEALERALLDLDLDGVSVYASPEADTPLLLCEGPYLPPSREYLERSVKKGGFGC